MSELPPNGSIVRLPWGRFRAIIVKPGMRPDTVVLRGWYLDRDTITEQYLTVQVDDITALEDE